MNATSKGTLLLSFEKPSADEAIQQNLVVTCGRTSSYFDVTCTGKACQAKIVPYPRQEVI